MTASAPVSDLAGWPRSEFSWGGRTHAYYERGQGPGVVLLPELPGITPELLGLADHLADSGFTVVVPSLFGTPGNPAFGARAALVITRVCITREFHAFATNARRPVTDYLRALARSLAERTPGPGVGIVGLCFTGGFALAAAVDDSVLAAVMGEPSLPLPLSAAHRADPGLSEQELRDVQVRTRDDGLCVLGLRFTEDRLVPGERFETLRDRLGDSFAYVELDSRPGNAAGFAPRSHSVLTHEVREIPGHPALEARRKVVAFLRRRLVEGDGAREPGSVPGPVPGP
ncbi:dienelactone hydrolase family protein [Streptomyces bambusae]|uniref:Dienelactone hydrolase n=1 Tax=Streptomyces bambusae TaxID=1550616 RepID=A0ABS6Z6A7_9ACTN|nr:dienelactone hydrolase family protein [Streptomyces bambusae]MBW5483289.1 dienelactone hydrolase [Streptomyces bambusae]